MTPDILQKGRTPALDELLKDLNQPQDSDQEVLRSLSEAFLMASDERAWSEATLGLAGEIQGHRERLSSLLGRDPGEVVTSLDYLVNEIKDPRRILRLRNAALAQAARLALMDNLTGLQNLMYLELVLPGRLERAKEARQALSMVILDLNGFGAFNKKYGHMVGNEALVKVAATLRVSLPHGAVAGRFGGDEFWVLLPGHNRRLAMEYMEGLGRMLAGVTVPLSDGAEAPTLSAGLGAACFPADGFLAETLMAHADKALIGTKSDRTKSLRLFVPSTTVSLTWKAPPGIPAPSRIAVAGDFNGWDSLSDPLTRAADGSWQTVMALEPGNYAYKFVRDGASWEPDPRAEEGVPDGFGGVNSILHVRG